MDFEDARPTRKTYVTLGGQRYELILVDKFTWPEAREAKAMCSMPLAEMEAEAMKGDPDAWFAWLYISMRRQHPTFTVADLTHMLGDSSVVQVIETIEKEAPEVADPDPPASATTSGSETKPNGSGSGVKIPPPSTLATSGPQTSEIPT